MMSQFGKCNVCAAPCVSCMRLGQELFPTESTSNFSSDESCEYEVSCEQGSETSAASSLMSEGGILESNKDQRSFVEGASPSLSVEYQRSDVDKMNKTVSSITVDSSFKSNSAEFSSLKDFHAGPISLEEHLRSCFMDQTESSSSIIMARAANDEHNQVVVDSKETIQFEVAENSVTESVNCSNHKEGNSSNGESALSDDVKVCDICGVAGQQEFLAVCSKCCIGVEHVYCMRIMLETVPDGNWICGECMLSEDKDKMTKTKFEKFVACRKYKSSNQSDQGGETLNSSDFVPGINTNGLDADKNRGDEANSLLYAMRTSGNVTCASMTKRLAIGTECVPSFISRDCGKAQAQDFEIEASNKLSLPNDPFSRLRSIQEKSGQYLPKSRQIQMETGNLCKPKSFNDSDKRPKVQRLDEIPRNGKFSIRNKEKGSSVQTMRKALPSNIFGPKSKRIPSQFSKDGGLKRLRCMKEHTSVEMTSNTRFKRLQVGSTKYGPLVSGSSRDMKFRFHGGITLPDVDGANTHDLKAVEVSNDSDAAIASNGKTACLPVADVVRDVLFPIVSDASQEVKCKGERFRHSLEARSPCSCSDAIGEEKLTVFLTSSNGTEKAPQTDFIYANECISNRSGSEYYGRTGSLGHASCCQLADGSSVSVLDTPVVKDTDGKSQIDVSCSFCNQINAYRTLAVPVIDYIWKGECEIQNSSRLPRVLYRIQAHLSTWSSSKIPEAVKKFSNKILLEEVSRLTVWPIQFQEFYPQDYNIGLYFFAEDIESYGNYKSLLQYMVDFDVALIRNFNRIELLIFSSHLLPESSRYWNGLLFLWGVFKERKVNGS